jgi:hypothetical protein
VTPIEDTVPARNNESRWWRAQVVGLFAGTAVGALLTVAAFQDGRLPLGAPSTLRDPCLTAGAARLIPQVPHWSGGGGRASADCLGNTGYSGSPAYSELEIAVYKQPAAQIQQRGCTALAGLGTVRPVPRLGVAACVVTEDGRLRITTVLVRYRQLQIMVRYGTESKDAATVERDALDAARKVTAAP